MSRQVLSVSLFGCEVFKISRRGDRPVEAEGEPAKLLTPDRHLPYGSRYSVARLDDEGAPTIPLRRNLTLTEAERVAGEIEESGMTVRVCAPGFFDDAVAPAALLAS